MSRGFRDSKGLDKASYWRRAGEGAYLSFDEDLTLERLKAETPWRVRGNTVLVPDRLLLRSGLDVYIGRKERSLYPVGETSEGKLALFEGEEIWRDGNGRDSGGCGSLDVRRCSVRAEFDGSLPRVDQIVATTWTEVKRGKVKR